MIYIDFTAALRHLRGVGSPWLVQGVRRGDAPGASAGEGLPPVPGKLSEKIRKWEYVEMAELLPEFWTSPKEEGNGTRRSSLRRTHQVTDTHTWVQCFATYVGVLAGRYPESIVELMAYLIQTCVQSLRGPHPAVVCTSQEHARIAGSSSLGPTSGAGARARDAAKPY